MKKRVMICILMALVMVFTAPATLTYAEGDEPGQQTEIQTLAAPSNLIWKDESTATAGWDAVDGANYYVVNVYVSSNGNEIGTTETGTTATELDLQHEVNTIIGNRPFEGFLVQFDVKAQYITDEITIDGPVSQKSDELVLSQAGKTVLNTPTNVSLDENYRISWDNYDPHADYYAFYYKVEYNGRTKTGFADHVVMSKNLSVSGTRASADITSAVRNAYDASGYSNQEVQISISVQASADYGSDYKDSVHSEYSNSISVAEGKPVLKKATNLTLDDNYRLSWENYDSHTDYYAFYYKVEYNGRTKTGFADHVIQYRNLSINGTKASADITSAVKNAYDASGYSGQEVQISIRIVACPSTGSSYQESAYSEYSNSISVSEGKPALNTATNLELKNNYRLSWDSYDAHADYYAFYYKTSYNGRSKTGFANHTILTRKISVSGTRATADISTALKNAYDAAGFKGETIEISIRIVACPSVGSEYKESAYSGYSNVIYYNPAGSTVINEITLSPEHPVIAVGRSMYIGKTISPSNAYYSKVNWSSDDNGTAPIDANGKVTGAKKGNTTITAQINNATKTIPVSVYEITSNVDDSEQSTEVMDTAKDAIDSLIVDGDATGTDINDVDAACEEIVQAAQSGDQFNVDLNIEEKEKNELDASWSDIQDAVGDKEFAAAYDVTVGISHTDSEGASHLIGNLTTFDSEVGFELEKPDNLPAVTENCNREFSLARIHEGSIEELPLTETDEGNYTAASNVFSDFVLLYKDVPCDHDYKNPVFNWSDDGKTCTVTYTCSVNADHKATYDCTVTSKVKEAATCSKKGTTTYTATYNDISDTKDVVDIDYDMSAHDYQNPVFNWSDDGKTCTVTYTCTRDADHKATYDCDVTSEVKEAATCSKKGITTYTATYKGLSDTKDVVDIEIVPSAHVFGDSYTVDEPATCAKEGRESIHCSECGAIKEGSERVIEKTTDHKYGAWNTTKEATCTEDGSKEKICSVCNDKVIEVIPATDHDWKAPTYSWTTDYKSVTATRVCKNDPSHVETETVNTTSAVTKKPTYTAKGQTTYTATFSNAAFSTQTKTVTNIAQLPKKANTITVKVKKPTVKYAKLKKKAQTILAKNAFVVSKAQGKVTYKRVSGNKKITINSAGKITLKKGLKKGTYKVRVKVTAAGTTAYKAGAKTVTLSIKVK